MAFYRTSSIKVRAQIWRGEFDIGGCVVEDILQTIYQEHASQGNTLGILLIKKGKSASLTDKFDAILLIVVKEAKQSIYIKHCASANGERK